MLLLRHQKRQNVMVLANFMVLAPVMVLACVMMLAMSGNLGVGHRKGAMDEVKRTEGFQLEVKARRAPRLLVTG